HPALGAALGPPLLQLVPDPVGPLLLAAALRVARRALVHAHEHVTLEGRHRLDATASGRPCRSRGRARRRCGGSGPLAALADEVDLLEEEIDLLLGVVEVRRDADAGARPVIAEEAPAVELAGDVGSAGEVEHHRAGPPGVVARRVEGEPALVDPLDDPAGGPLALVSDGARADLADDLGAGPRLVER